MYDLFIACWLRMVAGFLKWSIEINRKYELEINVLVNLGTSLIYISAICFSVLYSLNKEKVNCLVIYLPMLITSLYVFFYYLCFKVIKSVRESDENKQVTIEKMESMAIGLIGMLLCYILVMDYFLVSNEKFDNIFNIALKVIYFIGVFLVLSFSTIFPILKSISEIDKFFETNQP